MSGQTSGTAKKRGEREEGKGGREGGEREEEGFHPELLRI